MDKPKTRVDRRSFMKGSCASIAGLAVLSGSSDLLFAQRASVSRQVFPLNHKWLYSAKNVAGGNRTAFNDSTFTRVTIPHTNKMLPWHGFDDKDYQFVSLYRRHFTVPNGLQKHRAFIDFGGVMTAAKVTLNDHLLGEYRGGYTPFSFEITEHLNWRGDNVLAVEVDSTERNDIPPFGGEIDYLTFGGIYRDVTLRFVHSTFIENVFAKPVDVLQENRRLVVRCYLNSKTVAPRSLKVELLDGPTVISSATATVLAAGPFHDITLQNLRGIQLWDITNPKLYQVRVTLLEADSSVDSYETRTGFREAKFTPDGFFLNGKHLKLRGLNRHQTYPFVGQAMPARVQRRDAWILRKELKCNIVRTSHYPQSPHFLNACDELGLLVLEEIPGWQHVGDQAWQDLVSAVKKINEQLKPLSLQVLLSPCTRADDNLAVFEIRLDERNERSNYSMLCTVSSIGTLYLTRHLPGLTDSKSIGSTALTKEAIDDLILRFIENALGNRSRIEMHDDYAGHGQARRVA